MTGPLPPAEHDFVAVSLTRKGTALLGHKGDTPGKTGERTVVIDLKDHRRAVEKWLLEEVVSVCDAMQSDPGRAVPAEQVFATIRARHADRLKRRREPQG